MSNLTTTESFLKDVQNHKIKILHDDGIYRHVRFSDGSSNMYFDLITAPGLLLYRGDMGCYEFERLHDMFEFFRTDREYNKKMGRKLSINTGYWAEKCQSESRFGSGIKAFSHDSFEETVLNDAKEFAEEHDLSGEALEDFNDQIEDLVSSVSDGHEAYEALRECDFNSIEISDDEFLEFTAEDVFGPDAWEYDFTEYTHRFIWCCYAIAWGIEQYDLVKDEKKSKEAEAKAAAHE